jgi:hypothetical protein
MHCQRGTFILKDELVNFIPLHPLFIYFFDIIAEQFSYAI